MSKVPLGRLEKVDLRSYWEREATEFTPWLAQDDNIALLGETVGLELEVENQEVGVGPFRADILCRDTRSDSKVLIENQLEMTDHTHLGQLMTYAGGLEAGTIIWIASQFGEEHRAALDWLNRVTHDGINFFGIEIELWKIGVSPPAPRFNIVSKPNDWTKAVSDRTREVGEWGQFYLDYWNSLAEQLAKSGSPIKKIRRATGGWVPMKVESNAFLLWTIASVRKSRIGVGLDAKYELGDLGYRRFLQERQVIESEIGTELTWSRSKRGVGGWIGVTVPMNVKDRSTWPACHEWTQRMLEAYLRSFRSRILDLESLPGAGNE